jgi:hypothetical protein
MKIQDIAFLIIFAATVITRKHKPAVVIGLVFLTLSIPLFATWTFFTAQRLTYYAAALFLYATIALLAKSDG